MGRLADRFRTVMSSQSHELAGPAFIKLTAELPRYLHTERMPVP